MIRLAYEGELAGTGQRRWLDEGWSPVAALGPDRPDDIELDPKAVQRALRWKQRRHVRVGGVDLFDPNVNRAWIDQVMAVAGLACVMHDDPHQFQILTRESEHMRAYFRDKDTVGRVTRTMKRIGPGLPGENAAPTWPLPNVWLGVRIASKEENEKRVVDLVQTPAAMHVVRIERMGRDIELDFIHPPGRRIYNALEGYSYPRAMSPWDQRTAKVDWVVVDGCEPGERALAALRELRKQCTKHATALYVKGSARIPPELRSREHPNGDRQTCGTR